ncbi:hypothetical protein MRX96_052539, partial [Rhipicephalus microplus]
MSLKSAEPALVIPATTRSSLLTTANAQFRRHPVYPQRVAWINTNLLSPPSDSPQIHPQRAAWISPNLFSPPSDFSTDSPPMVTSIEFATDQSDGEQFNQG